MTLEKNLKILLIYLLLAECEVRAASYGASIFPSFYEKEGKNENPAITCRTDRASEDNKIFIIWPC